jgi:hypothetical protein
MLLSVSGYRAVAKPDDSPRWLLKLKNCIKLTPVTSTMFADETIGVSGLGRLGRFETRGATRRVRCS